MCLRRVQSSAAPLSLCDICEGNADHRLCLGAEQVVFGGATARCRRPLFLSPPRWICDSRVARRLTGGCRCDATIPGFCGLTAEAHHGFRHFRHAALLVSGSPPAPRCLSRRIRDTFTDTCIQPVRAVAGTPCSRRVFWL